MKFTLGFFLLVLCVLGRRAVVHGDEGMWLYSNPPKKLLKEKYGFDKPEAWYEHVQKSSVRFNSGGSGSFVSEDGLVMTNHHVGAGDLQKVSDEKHNYLKDGFYAKTQADEIKCKGLELNVLQSMSDVTAKIEAAVTKDMSPLDAVKARNAVIEQIKAANSDKEKNIRADVVTLYAGGQYHLYIYKKYTDIRIVFAPEQQAAFFGGDPDNFEYPRYDLDMTFFRVYENDKPIKCQNYLKWSAAGSKEGELVFVSGHPGRTNRQNTVAELEYLRDTGYPFGLQRLNRMEVAMTSWSQRTEENARRAREDLFGVQNSRKARIGGLGGLLDPKLLGRKVDQEAQLKSFIAGSSDPMVKAAGPAFETIAKAEKKRAEILKENTFYEGGGAFSSHLFGIARTLLRAAEEKAKPAGTRLREYEDSSIKSLELGLFSDEEIYDDFEILTLTDSLTFYATTFGGNDEMVQKVLAGKSPRDRAYELISGSKLKDPAVRKKIYEGGKAAIDASTDPMIALAKLVDARSRAVRKVFETEVDEPKRQAYAAIAKARYAKDGASTYPDATFTLRLAFGTVKGYTQDGKKIPAFTDIGGLYKWSAEHKNKEPFDLPARWVERKDKLDLKTPFNFVCTADIIGGNSGSPVINQAGEVVGLIFDGNIQSLVLDFIFDEEVARAVSVDSRAMIEALNKVYDAQDVATELTTGKKPVK
ncbi:S46 family peptidase [Telmatocola sphagniphila]|uniref:Dipeptidyl-peptidase n=1 Tax=Telmatocola sphagniphila TaxID=1123043 RepID=A0A8E6B4S0_9BACT|nr:S46 family peptidase [Telmatocola sphagniphila]QVL31101.1 S46 family peptidase [Telmatocola sphagniphila]